MKIAFKNGIYSKKYFYVAQIGLEYQGSADFLPWSPDYLGLQGCDTAPGHL